MTLWFFRLTVIIISPVIGWYKVSPDWRGIAAGVAAALFVIGVEIFIEHVPLSHLLYGALGGGLGFIFAVLINEVVLDKVLRGETSIEEAVRVFAVTRA